MSAAKQRKGSKTDVPASAPAVSDPKKVDAERYAKLIVGLSDKIPEKVRPYVVKAAPVIALIMVYIRIAVPHIVKFYAVVCEQLAKLPHHLMMALIGFAMCFFGGVFPGTIAAYEAWKLCGGKEGYQATKILMEQVSQVAEASRKDSLKDDDGDGIPDVDQITPQELAIRKVKLVMKTVDPVEVNAQFALLYTGWIGVMATLKIQFAMTVTLGAAIGDALYGPVEHFVQPPLLAMCPEEYKQWVPVVLKHTCKAVAISIAWWIQRVLSAVHSCIRGGLMFGREVVHYLNEKGHIKFDADDSYLDEAMGFAIAAVGLLTQFYFGFGVPFPLNIFFLPLQCVEGFIAWSVNN